MRANPASSERQRRLFGAALAAKRGGRGPHSPEALRLARSLPEATLRDFARRRS